MFPIAVQAPPESNEDRNADFEFALEVAELFFEFAGKLLLLPVRALTMYNAQLADRHNAQLAASNVTPYVVLRQLALAESDEVRNSLVANESIGCDILDRLALDNNRFIAAQARSRRDLVCNYSSRRVS